MLVQAFVRDVEAGEIGKIKENRSFVASLIGELARRSERCGFAIRPACLRRASRAIPSSDVSLIAVHSLTRRYGRRRGVEDVTFAVPEGALFGFLGPNGAGKTTAIRVMLGFLRPTTGTACIFGHDCWHHSKRIKAEIGYVPGDLRLPPWLTGIGTLRIVSAVRGRDLTRSWRDLGELFDLDMRVKVRNMSRGMRQKLGLIIALAHRPRLLVLDEPTSGLDPLMQGRFRSYLKDLSRAGHTIFFSSHTLSEVEAICDRVAILREGRLVADDTLETLRRQAGHEVMIRWKNVDAAVALRPPTFLTLHQRDGVVWNGTLGGPVGPLLEWLAGKPIDDLTVGRPDLESLFRRYYEQRGGGA